MRIDIQHLYMKWQYLMRDEGQDLIEYALVVALIAFAATAGMQSCSRCHQ